MTVGVLGKYDTLSVISKYDTLSCLTRGENGISLLGITGYVIIEVHDKVVMVEMMLSTVPFGDVTHTDDAILRATKNQLVGYGVGQS